MAKSSVKTINYADLKREVACTLGRVLFGMSRYENLKKEQRRKLDDLMRELDSTFKEHGLDWQLDTAPKFRVLEYKGKFAWSLIYSDKTKEEAAKITHMLNVGMSQERRAEGYHYEMEPITVERGSGDTERHG